MKRERDDNIVQGAAYFKELYDEASGANAHNMAVQLFSLEDIFATMLRDRPLSVLRLLATSKQLYGLLKRLPGFFMVLLDGVVATMAPHHPAYAFYVWEFHTGQFRHTMDRWSRLTATQFSDLCRELLQYNVERDWVTSKFEHTDPFKSSAYLVDTIFVGRDADIVHSAWRERYTAIREVLAFDEKVQQRWAWTIHANDEQRRKLCRIYTYMFPFSLGPFALLDTRRLHLHRMCLATVSVAPYDASTRVEWRQQKDGESEHLEALVKHMSLWPRHPSPARDTEHREKALAYYEKRRSVWDHEFAALIAWFDDVDMDARITECRDNLLIALELESEEREAGEAAEGGVDPVHAALIKPLPEPYDFLELAPYREQLRQLYHDTAIGRRALVSELAYLERTHSKELVEREFGQCVQCTGVTQTVDTARMVYMCAPCFETNAGQCRPLGHPGHGGGTRATFVVYPSSDIQRYFGVLYQNLLRLLRAALPDVEWLEQGEGPGLFVATLSTARIEKEITGHQDFKSYVDKLHGATPVILALSIGSQGEYQTPLPDRYGGQVQRVAYNTAYDVFDDEPNNAAVQATYRRLAEVGGGGVTRQPVVVVNKTAKSKRIVVYRSSDVQRYFDTLYHNLMRLLRAALPDVEWVEQGEGPGLFVGMLATSRVEKEIKYNADFKSYLQKLHGAKPVILGLSMGSQGVIHEAASDGYGGHVYRVTYSVTHDVFDDETNNATLQEMYRQF